VDSEPGRERALKSICRVLRKERSLAEDRKFLLRLSVEPRPCLFAEDGRRSLESWHPNL